ncbi:hypothetical protein AMS68_001450 [Peltaster fructicola]|uniref:Peptidase A1 domain-containing protein n=1 Tax=Peltaster fructicola TaxID=286661 RepID=A0A6H0XMI6_9PEZI|nr:hypothetical protein AMS68_001450 [Peltaster fructicola]
MKHQYGAGTVVLALTSIMAAIGGVRSQELVPRLAARADNLTIPAAISIGPSQYWDGNDGPWSSFPIQVGGGSTSQNVRVFPATAAYNTWTIGPDGCPSGLVNDCANKRGGLFYTNQSLTWILSSTYPTSIEVNLGLDLNANAGWDTVGLGWQGSGGPSVQHTVVFNVFSTKYWVGIFGLSPLPTNFTNQNSPQPSYMQSLYDNKLIPSRSYGYTAGNQYRLNKIFGSLTLGGYDQSRFSGGISFPFYADINRDLLVNLKAITAGDGTNLLPGGTISTMVDSTVPEIWLPQSACSAFEKAFGLTYDTSSKRYLVNGSTHAQLTQSQPTVNFTLTNDKSQEVTISLPYGAFDLNVSTPIVSGSSYYFPIQRAANDSQYTLGRAFLQEAYLIADYDRSNFTVAPCTWNQSQLSSPSIKSVLSPNLTAQVNAQQSSSSAQTSQTSQGISSGAIAGIVVGVVVLVLAVVAGVFFFMRRRKTHAELVELSEKGDGAANAKTTGPINELGDEGQVGELDAPFLTKPQEMESPYKFDPSRNGYMEMEGEHYGTGKHDAHEMAGTLASHEMDGARPIYEMHGSDVFEMPAHRLTKYGPPEK